MQIKDFGAFLVIGFFQFILFFDVLLVILRICNFLKVTADHRGRFVMLGDGDRFEAFLALGHKSVATDKVHEISALHEQLSHPGVVVAGAGDVAIATGFRLFSAHRMGHKGAERLAAESFG